MNDTYPGIEIRVRTEHGEILNHRSDVLHYELRQMWLMNGFTGDEWYPVGGTMHRAVLVEIRAVDVPALPPAPDYPHELYAAAPDTVRASDQTAGSRPSQPERPRAKLEPCANCPSIAGCSSFGGCLIAASIAAAAEPADVDHPAQDHLCEDLGMNHRWQPWPGRPGFEFCPDCPAWQKTPEPAPFPFAAVDVGNRRPGHRPAPPPGEVGDGAGSSLTEPVTEPARARRPRPRLNIGIARIARRARFRSGR